MRHLAERRAFFDNPTDTCSGVILQMAPLEVEGREATGPLDDVLWRITVVTQPKAVTSPRQWGVQLTTITTNESI